MRRIYSFLFLALIAGGLVTACSRQASTPDDPPADKPVVVNQLIVPAPGDGNNAKGGEPKVQPITEVVPDAKHEKYEAALLKALYLLAERQYPEALAAMEAAKSFKAPEHIRTEIAKLKDRLDQQAAAERTQEDIQTVLEQGKAAEAAQLATIALMQYGGADIAEKLAKLKLQADAVVAG